MTDTNEVDLTTLEQGDEVVFSDSKKALVNHVIECSSDYFTVFLFIIDGDRPEHIERDYRKDGVCVAFTYNPQIVQIIKNPKRWTDENMKAAFEAGKPTLESLFKHDWNFDVWLQQYKERKHEQ